jgi:hypothetical protein
MRNVLDVSSSSLNFLSGQATMLPIKGISAFFSESITILGVFGLSFKPVKDLLTSGVVEFTENFIKTGLMSGSWVIISLVRHDPLVVMINNSCGLAARAFLKNFKSVFI